MAVFCTLEQSDSGGPGLPRRASVGIEVVLALLEQDNRSHPKPQLSSQQQEQLLGEYLPAIVHLRTCASMTGTHSKDHSQQI